MGRQRGPVDTEVAEWRAGFLREIADEFGAEFADQATTVLDEEIAFYGEPDQAERRLYESIIPPLTRNSLRMERDG